MPPRFYCNSPLIANEIIVLPDNAGHHAANVLRLKRNDQIILFNGLKGEFSGNIDQITKKGVLVRVGEFHDVDRESPVLTELVQAVCVNEKMDWIIQKAVELGVNRIQPIIANRCVVRLSGERAQKRSEHWQHIIHSSCEQCGRNKIPELLPLLTYTEWLSQYRKDGTDSVIKSSKLMLSPTAYLQLSKLNSSINIDSFVLLIGPEGGLTPSEEEIAIANGFIAIRLGQRILRTESAGLAILSSIQALWGDY